MNKPAHLQRRDALALLGSPLLPAVPLLSALIAPQVAAAAAAKGVRTDQITVLYRPATADAPNRLDPAVQTAIRQLERHFIAKGFKVLQPSAEIYRLMDQGQGVVVTFAADAGFSLIFSAYKNLRPDPRQDGSIAEMRIESRVIVGRHVLSAEEGRGQMFTRTDPASREFGERRAMEVAAGKASEELADKTAEALKALTPESITQMLGPMASQTTQAEVVPVPPVGVIEKPPAAAPMPAPAPAAAPAPAPTTAAALPPPVAAAPAASPPSPRNRYALVVGMSNYAGVRADGVTGIKDLPGVAKDTVKVAQTLKAKGFPDNHGHHAARRAGHRQAVRDAMRKLAGAVQTDDLVLIFILGPRRRQGLQRLGLRHADPGRLQHSATPNARLLGAAEHGEQPARARWSGSTTPATRAVPPATSPRSWSSVARRAGQQRRARPRRAAPWRVPAPGPGLCDPHRVEPARDLLGDGRRRAVHQPLARRPEGRARRAAGAAVCRAGAAAGGERIEEHLPRAQRVCRSTRSRRRSWPSAAVATASSCEAAAMNSAAAGAGAAVPGRPARRRRQNCAPARCQPPGGYDGDCLRRLGQRPGPCHRHGPLRRGLHGRLRHRPGPLHLCRRHALRGPVRQRPRQRPGAFPLRRWRRAGRRVPQQPAAGRGPAAEARRARRCWSNCAAPR